MGKQAWNPPVHITTTLIKDAEAFEANVCRMPTRAPQQEAEIYRSMRDHLIQAHCADKRPAHKCCGQITITRDAIVLQCPRCGDDKKIIEGRP